MNWEHNERISGRPLHRSLIALAVPAVMSTIFGAIFEMADLFWIDKLGAAALAGVSSASYFIWMLRGLGLICAAGAIALVARRTGEKNEPGLLSTINHTVAAAFLFAVALIVVSTPIALYAFGWAQLPPDVIPLAVDYTVVFISGLIFVYMMMAFEFTIRGSGDTKSPMKITIVALVLNILLDPLFIFTFKLGVQGAAYATIVSQFIGSCLMGIVLLRKLPRLREHRFPRNLFISRTFWEQFRTIAYIGGPVGLSEAGFSFIYMLLIGIVAIYGKEPLGAMGFAHRLEALPFFICLGFAMAVEPMVGQFLGAGKPEQAKRSVYMAIKITFLILTVIVVFYFIFARQLYELFTDNPEVIAHGVRYMRIVVLFDVFLALEVVLTGAFSGTGYTRPTLLITFPITFARVPLAYLSAVIFGAVIEAVWWVIGITTLLKGLLLLYHFHKGKWAGKKI